MHYYKRNLGDYAKKAGRLSMLQHGAYNLLIDACYDREEFPTLEQAIDWAWASTTEEREAVEFVLSRFFELQSDGRYVQKRIAQEIEEYLEKAEKNRATAWQREENRKAKKEGREPILYETWKKEHEPCTSRAEKQHEPCTTGHLTKNQEPITNNQETILKPFAQSPAGSGQDDGEEKPPDDPKLFVLPTNKFTSAGETFGVTKSMITEWSQAYPALDVPCELLKARAWLHDNPKNRKTKNGMQRFLGSWLNRAQDRAPPNRPPGPRTPATAGTSTRQTSLQDDLHDTSWANSV